MCWGIPQIRTVLATALANDPLVRWDFPPTGPVVAAEPHSSMAGPQQATAELVESDQQPLSRVASYFMLAVERLVLQGRSFTVVDEGRILGAALWMPSGMERKPSLPRPRDFMGQLLGDEVLLESAERLQQAWEGAPECGGFYLADLGLLPGFQVRAGIEVDAALHGRTRGADVGGVREPPATWTSTVGLASLWCTRRPCSTRRSAACALSDEAIKKYLDKESLGLTK